jgi:uncharacterized protein involved in type VI secretion and phage assembly
MVQRENGIVIGIVESLDDDEDLGRIKVRYPHLDGKVSEWARLATPMGGKDRGLFFRPEKEDEVLVAHEQGEFTRPYIVGSLWSKVDPPPADDGKKVDNNWRFFRSRAGHLLKFDDTAGAERIEIAGSGGKHTMTIDVSGEKIEIRCSSGDVTVAAPAGTVTLDAKAVQIKAKTTLSLEAGGALTIKGSTVGIND